MVDLTGRWTVPTDQEQPMRDDVRHGDAEVGGG
jgi:hypothetical protein